MICKFAIHEDFGYSNYTVEGTTFHCAKKLNPNGEFDEFYGSDKRMEYAKECEGFEEGEGPKIDVDREDIDSLTDEQKAIYEMLSP
jgi:hypothetical protein